MLYTHTHYLTVLSEFISCSQRLSLSQGRDWLGCCTGVPLLRDPISVVLASDVALILLSLLFGFVCGLNAHW